MMKFISLTICITIIMLTGCSNNQETKNAQMQVIESFSNNGIENFKTDLQFYRNEIGSDDFYINYLSRIKKIEEIITLINNNDTNVSEALNDYKVNYGEDAYYKKIQEQSAANNNIYKKLSLLNENRNKILVNSDEIIELINELKTEVNFYLSNYEDISIYTLNEELDYLMNIMNAILDNDFNKFIEYYDANATFKYIDLNDYVTEKVESTFALSAYEKIVVDQLDILASIMKNPESMSVLEIRDFKGYGTYHGVSTNTYFEVSAQNGFGGYNREWYQIMDSDELTGDEIGDIYTVGKYVIIKLEGKPYQNNGNVKVNHEKIIYYYNL